ncbi:MAG: ATP-binding protein [Armatimonadota bacterium]
MANSVQELVVISGKGGTGKTSVVASFAALAEEAVLVDCDVDASDLHLILSPDVQQTIPFYGGNQAHINSDLCVGCMKCIRLCRFGAVSADGAANQHSDITVRIDPFQCEGCGVCAHFCPSGAIQMEPELNGDWYVSGTRFGPMVHARLGVAQENSGKLVTTIRKEASRIAREKAIPLVIIDGSPGIGCPVIASVTNASLVLIVTEPTLSGLHDLERVASLCQGLKLPLMVCVNKVDINLDMSLRIQKRCDKLNIAVAGTIRYDRCVTDAQLQMKSVVELDSNPVAEDIVSVWSSVMENLAAQSLITNNRIKEIPLI